MLKPQVRSVLMIALVAALLLRQGFAVVLLGLFALALGAAALWSRWALRRVSYTRTLSSPRAFVGDEIVLTQRVSNAKLLSLPSLRIDETVSERLDYGEQRVLAHSQSHLRTLRRWIALRPYEAVSWTLPMRCTRRGLYVFGPTQLEATDAFGFYQRTLDLAERTQLVVYPALIKLPRIALRAQHPVGETRAPRQLLTDPLRTVGVRDYHRDDPLKAIHWGATARRGELQTRVFEPTTSLDVAIVLNLDTFEYYWEGMSLDLVEHMISAAATVATEAAEQRLGLGLYSNGSPADSGQIIRIPPSRSPTQLGHVLEALGKLTPYSVLPITNLLHRLGPTLDWGATIVLVNAVDSETVRAALLRLTRRRRRVVWLFPGDRRPPSLPGVEIHLLDGAGAQWSDRRGGIVPIMEPEREA